MLEDTPRQLFRYIPYGPPLKSLYGNPEPADELKYRANYELSDEALSDVFDGKHYRDLLGRNGNVVVDGKQWSH